MSTTRQALPTGESTEDYPSGRRGLKQYLHAVADELFPFDGYREHQQEILHDSLDAMFVEGYDNIIIDGPTGIGKSPINVTIGQVTKHLAQYKGVLEDHFRFPLHGVESGKSFYTTPQKQLRNQLANDTDLKNYVQMLKSRSDYLCNAAGADGANCKDCNAPSMADDDDVTCRTMPGCTYWGEKEKAMRHDIATITFAMLVVDNHIPKEDMQGNQLSFGHRDVVLVDEGHNLESQVAGLFAGFTISAFMLPDSVYKDTERKIHWNMERFEQVSGILNSLYTRAKSFIERYEDDPTRENEVEQCENFIRKVEFCEREIREGRPWVVTVDTIGDSDKKKLTIKPVDVDNFLNHFVWSRGNKRVISSATIPYREKIDVWADRIGLDGSTKLISRPMPFPEENRLIHKNTIAGSMSGDGEDENWRDAIENIKTIAKKHEGEKGLIHTTSYQRAENVADSLGRSNVIVQDREKDKSDVIADWQASEKDILLSPSMMEGVDLYDDRCRWQVLMKVPYGYIGDSRVSYLLNERKDFEWYNQTAMLDVMQSVGRAVRGPDDYASYYIIDGAFESLMQKVATPEWFNSAVREREPAHWGNETLDSYQ